MPVWPALRELASCITTDQKLEIVTYDFVSQRVTAVICKLWRSMILLVREGEIFSASLFLGGNADAGAHGSVCGRCDGVNWMASREKDERQCIKTIMRPWSAAVVVS